MIPTICYIDIAIGVDCDALRVLKLAKFLSFTAKTLKKVEFGVKDLNAVIAAVGDVQATL